MTIELSVKLNFYYLQLRTAAGDFKLKPPIESLQRLRIVTCDLHLEFDGAEVLRRHAVGRGHGPHQPRWPVATPSGGRCGPRRQRGVCFAPRVVGVFTSFCPWSRARLIHRWYVS